MGTTVKNLGLAFLASAVMAAPAYGQTYGQERVVCTRDFNGAVICPQPQQQQVYVPTGPAQQHPVVVDRPNPIVTAVVGTALAVGTAALLNRAFNGIGGHHGHYNGPRYVAPADQYYRDNSWGSVDPHGNIYRNPTQGCFKTARGSTHCP